MILCIVVLLLCISCSVYETPQSGSFDSSEKLPDQEGWRKSIELTDQGRRRALVTAGHFSKYDHLQKAKLDGGITVLFFDSTGQKQVSKLTALQAEINEKTGEMEVSGSVVLIGEDSTRLETESLRWNRKTEKIIGQSRVIIRRSESIETGVGFQATSDLMRWTMQKVVTRFGHSYSSEME